MMATNAQRHRQYRRLEDRAERVQYDRERYLRECGWSYTCDTPGSLWLWRREYQGKTLLVATDTAMHMQAAFNSGVYDPGAPPRET